MDQPDGCSGLSKQLFGLSKRLFKLLSSCLDSPESCLDSSDGCSDHSGDCLDSLHLSGYFRSLSIPYRWLTKLSKCQSLSSRLLSRLLKQLFGSPRRLFGPSRWLSQQFRISFRTGETSDQTVHMTFPIFHMASKTIQMVIWTI